MSKTNDAVKALGELKSAVDQVALLKGIKRYVKKHTFINGLGHAQVYPGVVLDYVEKKLKKLTGGK